MTEQTDDDFDAAHADPTIDTWSSASRQHYIDTGRYLRVEES